ncbi:UvrD-helicase domain-containing protein [Alicyclobacillus sp. SO9]|uniref:UvrD-helicase domain-containing protein n=1 Tax=Alicyclobacillus sp. SO9 TaxID=2665646 RepID=UPI001E3B4641|nr:UvrD-helicase domain-containing protein [Alicyclobacillus sp. SO9]
MFAATPSVEEILNGLNKPQREAVETTEGPLLVVAGAGSGKTSVLTRRIAYLIAERRVAPWSILAITFTNKAAREMRNRLEQLIGAFASDVWAATFHSTCVRILRRDIDKLGWDRNFTVLDDSDVMSVIKRILTNQNVNTKQFDPRAVRGAISSHKNVLRTADRAKDGAQTPFEEVAADAYLEYQRQLRMNNSLDFDDLIMKTVQLFEQAPDVLEFYHNKFRYIHVDEYQDTNHAQYRLVHLLAKKHKNLCVVGDSDQSIYGWRGADIRNILQFERDYKEAKVIRLEQNYRSTKVILNIANEVIKNNSERKAKTLWTENAEGGKAVLFTADDERSEAHYVVDTIEGLRKDNRGYSDFAILYRTNAQSRVIEEILMQRGVPYRIYGGLKFYDRKEIKDILAYLRLVANPSDEISLRRVINVPKRGIGATTLQKLQDLADARQFSLFDALQFAEQANIRGKILKAVTEFTEQIVQLNKQVTYLNVTELTQEILKRTGYRQQLHLENTLESQSRIENLDEFLTVTMEFDKTWDAEIEASEAQRPASDNSQPADDTQSALAVTEGNAEEAAPAELVFTADVGPVITGPEQRLTDFLAEVALVADTDLNGGKPDGAEADSNQVVLMTLHSAKGLEFPHVFLVGMEEGMFPHSRSLFDDGEMQEERRLCYVGVTRAQNQLYLTFSRVRTIFGEFRRQRHSRFLDEIPAQLLEPVGGNLSSFGSDGGGAGFQSDTERSEFGIRDGFRGGNHQESSHFGKEGARLQREKAGRSKGFDSTRAQLQTQGTGNPTNDGGQAKTFEYKPGDKVEHRKWGQGTVIQVRGEGEDLMAKIAFPAPVGIKELAVKFAPIQKAED